MALGIDIHPVYQKDINWSALDPSVEFIWLKISDGGSAYRKTVGNKLYTPDAHAAGMKTTKAACGGYHYAEFSPTPEIQADVLTREVKRLGLTSLCPALDIEAPFTPNATAMDFAKRFISRMKSHGWEKVAIYGYTAMMQYLRPDLWGVPGLIIWAARPAPIGELGLYKGRTDVHQFNSAGTVRGIAGQTDLNRTLNDSLLGEKASETPVSLTAQRMESMSYTAITLGTFGQTGFKSAVRFDDGSFVDITDDGRAMQSSQGNVTNKLVPVINCDNPATYDRFNGGEV